MTFLRNIVINLRASGPAAVLIALIGGITLIGLIGEGEHSRSALNILAFMAGALGLALAQRTGKDD